MSELTRWEPCTDGTNAGMQVVDDGGWLLREHAEDRYAALLASHKELVGALKALDSHIDFSEDTPDNSAWTFDKGEGINQACAQAKAALERAETLTGQ